MTSQARNFSKKSEKLESIERMSPATVTKTPYVKKCGQKRFIGGIVA